MNVKPLFLKSYTLIFFLPLLAGFACDTRSPEDKHLLRHQRVFVLYDTLEPEILSETMAPDADSSYLEYVFRSYNLQDIKQVDSTIRVDLRYAGTNNFMGINFYDGLRHAYFPCEVAIALSNAQQYLRSVNPSYSLLIWDAARPLHIQQMMWDSLKMPDDKKFNYLSPPYETSLHNYGCAVDLTIADLSTGKTLDMGSDFDTFEKISQPVYEQLYLSKGELSVESVNNRQLLRRVMKRGGFSPIPSEWWHFGYGNKTLAAAKFKLIK